MPTPRKHVPLARAVGEPVLATVDEAHPRASHEIHNGAGDEDLSRPSTLRDAAHVVDPQFTIVAKMHKALLAGFKRADRPIGVSRR